MPVRVRDADGNFVTIGQDAGGNQRFYVNAQLQNEALANGGKIFVAIIDGLNLGTGADEKNIMLLKNPASSGVNLLLKQIIVSSVKTSGGTNMRYYRQTTVSANGTTLTVRNKRNPAITGEAEAYQLPTVTSRGNLLGVFGIAGAGQLSHVDDYELFIAENTNMLITLEQPSSNQTYSINLIWADEWRSDRSCE
jgi:hypothetical protein